jgi:hypothetical protein
METHDNLGWTGPTSEGFPATKWGLCLWLWRNKAYTLRNFFRANPTETELMYQYQEIRKNVEIYKIGIWFQRRYTLRFKKFKIWVDIGWKLKPYFDGHRPVGKTATGIIIPFSIRTDDYDEDQR